MSEERVEKPQFPVPDGWFTFGSHVDQPVRLEFSEDVDETGLPLWERPLSSTPAKPAAERPTEGEGD